MTNKEDGSKPDKSTPNKPTPEKLTAGKSAESKPTASKIDEQKSQDSGAKSDGSGDGSQTSGRKGTVPPSGSVAKKATTIDLKAEDVTKPSASGSSKVDEKSANPPAGKDGGALKASANKSTKAPESKKTDQEKSGSKTAAEKKPDGASNKKPSPSTPKQSSEARATPSKSGGGFFRSLAAAIVGGVIAILGMVGGQQAGLIQTSGSGDATSSLEERLKVLEASSSDEVEGVTSEDLEALRAELADTTASGTENSVDADAFSTLEKEVAELRSLVSEGGAGENAALESLSQSLESLQVTKDEMASTLANLQTEIADVEEKVAAVSSSTGSATDASATEALAGLEAKVTALEEALSAENSDVLEQALSQQTALSDDVKALEEKINNDLAALANELKASEPSLNVEALAAQKAGVAVAAQQLASAFSDGTPFAAPLAVLEANGLGGSLDAVSDYASEGLPTLAKLSSDVKTIAKQYKNDAVVEQETAQEEGTLSPTDKLVRNVLSLVKTGGSANAPDKAALFADLEAQARSGDVTGAGETLSALGGNAVTLFADWKSELEARLGAKDVLAAFNKEVLDTLGGSSSSPTSDDQADSSENAGESQ